MVLDLATYFLRSESQHSHKPFGDRIPGRRWQQLLTKANSKSCCTFTEFRYMNVLVVIPPRCTFMPDNQNVLKIVMFMVSM